MKIISLTAENIKKLVAVEITPDGNMVQITGKNGQGKSSILDAIWWAIVGADAIQAQPIRKGQTKAKIKLDLGTLKVERRFTDKGNYLTVENEEGARYPSPQKMLDDLIGALSFDPLAFARMKPREQFEALRSIAKLDIDLDELDAANKADFGKRTEVNRLAKQTCLMVDSYNIPADLPAEAIDTKPLLTELQEVGTHNGDIETRKARRDAVADQISQGQKELIVLANDEKRLRADFEAAMNSLEEKRAAVTDRITKAQQRLDEAPPLPEPKDAAEVRERLEKAEAINKLIEARARRDLLAKEAEGLEAQSEALTKAMEARAKQKADAIAAAKMPVEGLGFGDSIVTFNGIPFEQCSSAEQLRVSMAIAMAANPKLRVIRIQDGSLLDEESLAAIGKMAEEKDYQVWIERVETSGKVGFIVEDGHVRPAGAEPKTQAAE
jgi:DNA repair exonuclease SbcCD ATPase subunit